ncbi:MAG: hypothetical protein AAGI07_10815 [Bacteroidota bacterium]
MTEEQYIAICKKMIEQKLYPNQSVIKLKQRDFNYLSILIEEKSGILLSLSTLKRLWSNAFQQPHPTTLNALVSILDFKEWNDFKFHQQKKQSKSIPFLAKSAKKYLLSMFISVLLISTGLIYWSFTKQVDNSLVINGQVNFTADKMVTSGVPNSVIFEYDLSQVEADSFFIQQSWNEQYKEPIDPKSKYFTSIYYYPGFHRAKLIANDSILKIHKVHITTDGWIGHAFNGYFPKTPKYLTENLVHYGILEASAEQLKHAQIDITQPYTLTYSNIRDFGNLPSSDFQLHTRLKYDSINRAVCPVMEVRILCEEHIFYIQLTEPGCVSNLNMKLGDTYISGKTNNLAKFGTDVYNWQDLSLHVENKKAIITLNSQQIFNTTFSNDLGKVVGLVLMFNGLGAAEAISLGDTEGKILYDEVFLL